MNRSFRYGMTCVLALAGTPALAMYRCGNVFQDKPCDSGTEIRLSPSGRPAAGQGPAPAPPPVAAAAATAPANFAAACARFGDQARRMVWKREGGATQEQQLAERGTLPPGEHARTVRDVYARRGTAPEIQAQIEAECVADKQKEAEAADLLSRLRRQAGETAGGPAAAAPTTATAGDSARASTPAGNKPSASTCKGLRRSVDDVNALLRQGGSARSMEYLQNQRREAETSFSKAGCS